MATGLPPGNTARDNERQHTQTIRKTLTYDQAGNFVNGNSIGMIPAGAFIIGTHVDVSAAFNNGTTNDVSIGTNPTLYNNIATTAQIVAGTAGPKRYLPPTLTVDQVTAPTMVYLKTNMTGTAATAGQCTIVIEFCVNRDL